MENTISYDNICGTGEAAEVLGVSKQRIHSLRKHPSFPAPIREISASPIWDKTHLVEFLTIWQPRKKKTAEVINTEVSNEELHGLAA
jgi:hypothetical protein